MNRILGLAALLTLLAGLPTTADEHDLQADLEQLNAWFAGRFDNYWQVRLEQSEPPEHPHGRIHSIFAPVELPEIGEHVYYVQQYSDGDPTKIYRQRLYSFSANSEEASALTRSDPLVLAKSDPSADPSLRSSRHRQRRVLRSRRPARVLGV